MHEVYDVLRWKTDQSGAGQRVRERRLLVNGYRAMAKNGKIGDTFVVPDPESDGGDFWLGYAVADDDNADDTRQVGAQAWRLAQDVAKCPWQGLFGTKFKRGDEVILLRYLERRSGSDSMYYLPSGRAGKPNEQWVHAHAVRKVGVTLYDRLKPRRSRRTQPQVMGATDTRLCTRYLWSDDLAACKLAVAAD